MKTKSKSSSIKISGITLAVAGALGFQGVIFAADPPPPSDFGRVGNKGEAAESEKKTTDRLDRSIEGPRTPLSTPSQDAQITLGGARPTVMGKVLKIQGEDYLVKDSSGSEVRFRVNKDTNMICGAGMAEGGDTMSTGRVTRQEHQEIPPTVHMQEQMSRQHGQQQSQHAQSSGQQQEQAGQQIVQEQLGGQSPSQSQQGQTGQAERQGAQGSQGMGEERQRIGDQSGTQSPTALGEHSGTDIARGSGFEVGPKSGCAFHVGDLVKAEVSDLGAALLVKRISEKDIDPSKAMGSGPKILPEQSGGMPGHQAAAQQAEQALKPGSVPAPPDLQNPEHITSGQRSAKADKQPENLCEGCQVLRGQVLRSDHGSLLVKDASQKEIRLKIDEQTQMGSLSQPRGGTFLEGDRIEAYVTPDGHIWSITTLKQQQGQPGALGAPGD